MAPTTLNIDKVRVRVRYRKVLGDLRSLIAKEPWAIQNLCQRFAPQIQSLRLTHEVNQDELDYSKLTGAHSDLDR